MDNPSIFSESESFSELIETGGLVQDDGDLRIDFSSALTLDVFLTNSVDSGQTILGKDLGELESQ